MNPFPLHPGQRVVEELTPGRLRVVAAVRLSKYTDASTSPEVQTEYTTDATHAIGGEIVGWANDVDVSALKTTPWEREQLRYWLDHPEEWDVMIWQRMDRAVRSMADMADLGRYAKKHGKRLIFASGPGGGRLELDFSSPMSELIMLILAFAAQLEGQTIMERNRGAAAHLASLGRWAGGIIPYGFIPVRKMFPDGNEGWWLGRDVDLTWQYVLEMVSLASDPFDPRGYAAIRDHLDEIKAVTPKNHRARLATPPRDPDPRSRWRDTTVRDILRSQVLRGYLVREDGTVVRDSSGEPVMQGEPLIDDEAWFQLQAALDRLAAPNAGQSRRKDAHPLLDVIQCGTCGANMYFTWTQDRRKRRDYADALTAALVRDPRYAARAHGDGQVSVQASPAVATALTSSTKLEGFALPSDVGRLVLSGEKITADQLRELWATLGVSGDVDEVIGDTRKEYFRCKGDDHDEGQAAPNVPAGETLAFVDREFRKRFARIRKSQVVVTGGVDNRPAIAELRDDIDALGIQLAKLRGAAADMVAKQLNGMADRLAELEKTPLIPAQRRTVYLDGTWVDDWDRSPGWQERRRILLVVGAKVTVGESTGWRRPADERLSFDVGTHIDPEQDAADEARHQAEL
ncbi:recombinase family protein [Streptomyces wuyuanensis]|uniref:recombinase family protein n=1 Tax=Streptomyces wuyuanensis TaxID=1196353 RepID=UPI0034196F8E